MPKQTREQRLHALLVANVVRTTRAEVKEIWRVGSADRAARELIGVLEAPPFWAERWRVEAALLAIPGVGPVRAGWLMREVGIAPSKTVSGLTSRQRDELIAWLDERCGP